MALLPHEKALVQRLKNEPFSLIGMYGRHGDAQEIAARFKQENITWRNAMDLCPDGAEAEAHPLWSSWAVRGFPQFYLLDAEGVIRVKWFGNPGEDVLDRTVDGYLAELRPR